MQLRLVTTATGIALLALGLASCSTTSTSDSVVGSTAPDAVNTGIFTVTAQPDSNGSALLSAINQATKTIDIPIYEINDPAVNKALMDAKARGVNIRTVQNAQWWQTADQKYAPSGYAANVDFAQALTAAPGPGTFTPHWSNNNFSITHQKSVIVDAADSSGNALPAANLPSTAMAVISTGNFNAYSYNAQTGKCTSTSEPCTAFSARDYQLATSDPGVVAEMATVFVNDFGCSTRTTIVPSGLTNDDQLVWSNGTTGANPTDAAGQYPSVQEGYPYFVDDGGNVADQGNSRGIIEKVIDVAQPGDILRVTNEEMSDAQITGYLAQAAKEGVEVRVVMTYPSVSTSGGQKQLANLQKIADAGGTVRLFANNLALYIHAKTVTVERAGKPIAGYVGSENFSQSSLEFNRELGAQLFPGDEAAMTVINTTFDGDFNTTKNTTILPKSSPSPSPTSSATSSPTAASKTSPALSAQQLKDFAAPNPLAPQERPLADSPTLP
ncbi:MAG: phospholipase D-like domain-containing protein, partial [Candidatus Nanopelagicales bacterium]